MRILFLALAALLLTHCPAAEGDDPIPPPPDVLPPSPPPPPPPEPFPPGMVEPSPVCGGNRVSVQSIEVEPALGPSPGCLPGEDCRVASIAVGRRARSPNIVVTLQSGRRFFLQIPMVSQTASAWLERPPVFGLLESMGEHNFRCEASSREVRCEDMDRTPELSYEAESEIVALEAGNYWGCAVTTEGETACFGRVECDSCFESAGFVDVAIANSMACFLHESGAAHCLGDGIVTVEEKHEGPFIELDGSGDMICGLRDDGRVFCWGELEPLPFGEGGAERCLCRCEEFPSEIPSLAGATSIAVGRGHVCVLLASGEVKCWGKGERGQLGDGFAFRQRTTTLALQGVVEIDAGVNTTCARRVDDTIYCWGVRGTLPLVGRATACESEVCVGLPQPLAGFAPR